MQAGFWKADWFLGVLVHDAGEEHDYCYLAMDLLEGDNLARTGSGLEL
jgi:hypothetical protein